MDPTRLQHTEQGPLVRKIDTDFEQGLDAIRRGRIQTGDPTPAKTNPVRPLKPRTWTPRRDR